MVHRSELMQDRLIDFSVSVCRMIGQLPSDLFSAHVSRQILRCCTALPPNYAEAQSAESRQDFIHKMRICLKELRETHVWLRMLERNEMPGWAPHLISAFGNRQSAIDFSIAKPSIVSGPHLL